MNNPTSRSGGLSRRRFSQRALALTSAAMLGPLASRAALAQAGAKPTIERWLEGEVKANYGVAPTYASTPITLKFSSFLAPNSSLAQLHMRAFKRLEADTNGKLVVRAFWGNTLANAQRGAFEAIAGGVADFGQAYVAFDPGGTELFQAMQIPFQFVDSLQASWTGTEVYPKYLKREYESKGVYLVRLSTTRPLQLLSISAPIETMADLKGKKMGSTGPLSAKFITALGASPNPLQVTEAYTAFQSGVIDVLPAHDAGARLFRFGELAKFRTLANLWVSDTEVGINKEAFDRLPPDLKRIFYHWSQLWNQVEVNLYYENESIDAAAEMQKRGVRTVELSPQERGKWVAATQPVVDQFVATAQGKGLPAKDLLNDIQATAARYKGRSAEDITKALLDKPIPGLIAF